MALKGRGEVRVVILGDSVVLLYLQGRLENEQVDTAPPYTR